MRSFRDGTGTEWIVWAVHPQEEASRHHERRSVADRRLSPAPEPVIERRVRTDRRAASDDSRDWRTIRMHYPNGWLTFQSGTVRRRLSPIPVGWASFTEAQLVRLLGVAQPARGAVRAIWGPSADRAP
jgi:hypothetical protein